MIKRNAAELVRVELADTPAASLLGPRQVGKTTLAKALVEELDGASAYIDLQSGEGKLIRQDIGGFVAARPNHLIILDEVQVAPELFGELRSLIDANRQPGRFLLLGSASPTLIRQASDSLAGRIGHVELRPFAWSETRNVVTASDHWYAGGFPEPLLQRVGRRRRKWFENFVRSFVEQDIPELGYSLDATHMTRLLSMVAHVHGGLENASSLSRSLGISAPSVTRYLNVLEQAFLIRRLRPLHTNTSKRLVKSPRLYVRDSGLLHYFHNVEDFAHLERHPVVGASWEGYAIKEIIQAAPDGYQPYFYRTQAGAELDLVLERGASKLAFEMKRAQSPVLTKGFYNAIADVAPEHTYVVTPGTNRLLLKPGIEVLGLQVLLQEWQGS